MGEEEAEVEEHLQGHARYTAAFSDLCAREAAIHRGIAAERAAMLQLQNDVQALQVSVIFQCIWLNWLNTRSCNLQGTTIHFHVFAFYLCIILNISGI